MQLSNVENGKSVRILYFHGGIWLEDKLRQLGLLPGSSARKLRQAPWGGPIMVEVDGRTIAIGKGIASKIYVEEERRECDSR
ncbi:MAG: FeoA family protein [Chloroflexota bacterium]